MNGPYGNKFPYTNFHEMNLDWMIQIAKDFLDQYSNIQTTITDGLNSINESAEESVTALETKAAELEGLLQAWYTSHSADIANELASAIVSFSAEVNSQIDHFNSVANAKQESVLDSIPDDYTTLSNSVNALKIYSMESLLNSVLSYNSQTVNGITFTWSNGVCDVNGTSSSAAINLLTNNISLPTGLEAGKEYYCNYHTTNPNIRFSLVFRETENGTATYVEFNEPKFFTVPANANYVRIRIYIGSGITCSHDTIYGCDIVNIKLFGDIIKNIPLDVINYNNSSTIRDYIVMTNSTVNGISYTWNIDNSCTVNGTASAISIKMLMDKQLLPNRIIPGKSYHVRYKTTNNDVKLGLMFYRTENDEDPYYYYFTQDGYITVPSDATYIRVRLYVPADAVINNAKVSAVDIIDTQFINETFYGNKSLEDNKTMAMTYFNYTNKYSSENPFSFTDIPANSYIFTNTQNISNLPSFFTSNYIWIFTFANLINTSVKEYIILEPTTNRLYTGYTSNNGETIYWVERTAMKHIKILCIGSSFNEDSIAYAPFIIKTICPDLKITMGCVYSSGASIDNYNTWFNTTQTVNYYKYSPDGNTWSSSSSKTVKQCLDDEDWDIITISQAAALLGVESSYDNTNSYINKIFDYMRTSQHKSIKLGFVMPQAALGYTDVYTYSDMVDCVQNVYEKTPIDFVIPCGTAIENARNTILNDVGDNGGLTYDSTGHLQEGLPVLISSYVTALVFMKVCGFEEYGIMGDGTNPTAAWVSSHNIMGQNGTSTGMTDQNRAIGQKCAVQAVKFPYTRTSIY